MLFAPSIQDPAMATHCSCSLSGYNSYYKDVHSIRCQYINAHSSHRLHTWLCCAEVQSGTALISFVNTVVVCVGVCMYVCVRPQEANQTTTFMRKQTPLSLSGPSPTLPLWIFYSLLHIYRPLPSPCCPTASSLFQAHLPSVLLFTWNPLRNLCRAGFAICSLPCLCM